MSTPQHLKYSKEHEWVRVEGNIAYIGITSFAQEELGDIVFVELPSLGDELVQNKTFGTVESVKTVSDLFAPLSGKIIAINQKLENSPELINEAPYEGGWMLQLEIKEASELDQLLDAEAYANLIKRG